MQMILIFFIGLFVGITCMCLLQVKRENNNLNYEMKLRKAADKWKKIRDGRQKRYDLKIYEDQELRETDENAIIIAQLVSEELENIL